MSNLEQIEAAESLSWSEIRIWRDTDGDEFVLAKKLFQGLVVGVSRANRAKHPNKHGQKSLNVRQNYEDDVEQLTSCMSIMQRVTISNSNTPLLSCRRIMSPIMDSRSQTPPGSLPRSEWRTEWKFSTSGGELELSDPMSLCDNLPVPGCHAIRRKQEGWDAARLPRESREANVGFEPQNFRSVTSRSNHRAISLSNRKINKLMFLTGPSPSLSLHGGETAQWLECEFTDRKVCDSNPTSASRLP
ncbi:hypothetical protein T265_05241 [Opisthorchis viverrini]|uniref:Uncharacterized protein n=1 Tax=Opisthorchis viverrini TaxID=6198 RepID=A0A074ZL24_OPIVI|nr:hypothetical protein T265_05241 [Opisthorchis viverrini]KER27751.1 hypothetical protein T265_05241 [Opisthorchis viverrini]